MGDRKFIIFVNRHNLNRMRDENLPFRLLRMPIRISNLDPHLRNEILGHQEIESPPTSVIRVAHSRESSPEVTSNKKRRADEAGSSNTILSDMANQEDSWIENKQIILKNYIGERNPIESDMELRIRKVKLMVPEESGCILLRNIYLSCDPSMRGRMREMRDCDDRNYGLPIVPGNVIVGFGISEVIDSDNPDFKVGDLVRGFTNWEEYSLIQKINLSEKIQSQDFPISYYVGLLGMPGLAAYAGFYKVCSPKRGEAVFVSAAFGAVGQLVGQLAKLHGCYVVGSAGTIQKVNLLKNKFGFDEAFNYKEEPDLDLALKRYFPRGIDIYFDNVGGAMLDAALLNMKTFGRIAMCGMMSQLSVSDAEEIHNLSLTTTRCLRIQGFVYKDYFHLLPEFQEHIISNYRQRKIICKEHITEGIENAISALVGLFSGKNVGKAVVHISVDVTSKLSTCDAPMMS